MLSCSDLIGKVFCFLPVLFSIIFLIRLKEIWKDKALFIFCLLAIGASLKTFFYTELTRYGYFTLPLLFIASVIIFDKFACKQKSIQNKEKLILYLIGFLSLVLFITHFNIRLIIGNNSLFGVNDNLMSTKVTNKSINVMVDYLKENTNLNDRVLVYPEGEIINFLAGRETDYMYYSLHPIFMETFGEKNVINRIRKEHIEYIIIVKGFGLPDFGTDNTYQDFENFVQNDYYLSFVVKSFETENILYLYKLK